MVLLLKKLLFFVSISTHIDSCWIVWMMMCDSGRTQAPRHVLIVILLSPDATVMVIDHWSGCSILDKLSLFPYLVIDNGDTLPDRQ